MSNETYLFEISWEVCNKIGGIHTVITSKLPQITKHFKESNYYLLGIYNDTTKQNYMPINTPAEFIEKEKKLNELGIIIHFGKWNINNTSPNVILIEYLNYSLNIDKIKTILWEKYQIDSLNSQWYDYDEAILWSWVCGVIIHTLTEDKIDKVITHAHEWMSGGAIFYLDQFASKEKYKTVFTTHATMLGRALSGRGENIIQTQNEIDPEKYAYEVGVYTKHQTEKALSKHATIFTTVSDITNNEAFYFYGKFADILLYNGFDPLIEIDKEKEKQELDNLIKKYFHNFYEINLNHTKIIYTSGRNEVKNKGVDLLIDSLGELNKKLKELNKEETLIVFFLIPIGEFQFDPLVSDSIKNYHTNTKPEKTYPYVPLSTHLLPIDNEIIQLFIKNQLLNTKEDKIKVILNPSYISEKEHFFCKHYYNAISAMDLGVFPSYYEPWGYTPMENLAYSIPSITTDLAGFGKYFQEKENSCDCNFILERKDKTYDESKEILTNQLFAFTKKYKDELNVMKNKSKISSQSFSWNLFIENYLNAYNQALNK